MIMWDIEPFAFYQVSLQQLLTPTLTLNPLSPPYMHACM